MCSNSSRAVRFYEFLRSGADFRGPAMAAFFLSLILSFIAICGSDDLNRDGMLYVDAARALLNEGWEAARARFDWLFLSALIAGVSFITGLEPELAGYILSALLLATACALMVLISGRTLLGSAWAACLIVLAMPGFNEYRDQLLREFGFWCFTLLALWCALRWFERPTWFGAISGQVALMMAAAFRVEALAFFPIIIGWQLYVRRANLSLNVIGGVLILPVLAVVLVSTALSLGFFDLDGRLRLYLSMINLTAKGRQLAAQVEAFRTAVLPELAHGDAHYMLLIGVLSAIPVKFLKGLGVFVVPLIFALHRGWRVPAASLLGGVFAVYVLILCAFASEMLFVTGRYVSFLTLLIVPLVAFGAMLMVSRWPRMQWAFVLIALVVSLDNVVSLSESKPQFRQAGAWLVQNVSEPGDIYIEDIRVRYYSGHPLIQPPRREVAMRLPRRAQYRLFVIEWPGELGEEPLSDWLRRHQMGLVKRFDGRGADVLVLKPQ